MNPYVWNYCKFPVDHRKIHVGEAFRDKHAMLIMEGLIKCTVLPPKRLYSQSYHSAAKINCFLYLCRTCAFECNFSGQCVNESTAQKCPTSTWFLHEVRRAIQNGYQFLDIMEVYDFEWRNTIRKHARTFNLRSIWTRPLNLKPRLAAPQLTSKLRGMGTLCRDFKCQRRRAVELGSIRTNAAKRGLAKHFMYSIWGKLAEMQNRTKTKLISDPQELYRFLTTPGSKLCTWYSLAIALSGDRGDTQRRSKRLSCVTLNYVVAAYVACVGRMHLYAYLDKIGERTLLRHRQCNIFAEERPTTPDRMWWRAGGHYFRTKGERVHFRIC